ncbi:MAG: major capsid protein [Microviridae sp.]|nr:MAG: major capsid protein [Microviridae sp.]
MHRNKSVNVHRFAMTPSPEIPRSSFNIQKSHKTTFDAGFLIPIYVDEVLPGDTFRLSMTAFCRLATPLFPIMDNMYLESFFFFVPNRLVWSNWTKMMGEQDAPGDSIDFTVPQSESPIGGYAVGSLQDYMGLPTAGQVEPASRILHSAMWLRAYNMIYNEWFRDENLQTPVVEAKGNGPDAPSDFVLLRRGKRHDYFTSCLPWPQKGESVSIPLGTSAPILAYGDKIPLWRVEGLGADHVLEGVTGTANVQLDGAPASSGRLAWNDPKLFADLSDATAATINQLRQSFQVQKLLERDARGGTRYTEILRSHFGVQSPDARLQRPEYLGGGSTPIQVNPIAQNSATSESGTGTPLGTLGAMGTGLAAGHGFSASFVEHGMVIGLVSLRADLNYQQGLRKMWSRKTRYDYYFPAFAMLGEQSVLSKEIYCDGTAGDETVFGYQERWAEYRYNPSIVSGLFRSTSAGTLDAWHLAQRFDNRPGLNTQFIQETPPLDRVLAVPSTTGKQLICDTFFNIHAARPLPLYSVPGLIDHF